VLVGMAVRPPPVLDAEPDLVLGVTSAVAAVSRCVGVLALEDVWVVVKWLCGTWVM
jgi:hypothetical protein